MEILVKSSPSSVNTIVDVSPIGSEVNLYPQNSTNAWSFDLLSFIPSHVLDLDGKP